MSVIYEVNLTVKRKVEEDFRIWLTDHIREVLSIDGFESASWFLVLDMPVGEDEVNWTVHYRLESQDALDRYLKNHAPRLRQPAIDKFGDQFRAVRRVLKPLQNYSKK